jgi:hypothetical protein
MSNTDLLRSFLEPIKLKGKDIKPGYYFYLAFPEKYGEPDIGWLEIVSIAKWTAEDIVVRYKERFNPPMILQMETEYLVKTK